MKKLTSFIFYLSFFIFPLATHAQGWPQEYDGVMLQGFYWDSYTASKWTKLESQVDELANYFSLVWIPQSAKAASEPSMGYNPLYWFSNYNSSFGTKAELRSLINTFKSKGIGTIADVVVNHCGNVSNWVDFPRETYGGETYQLLSTDICANDDGGATMTWANANGYQLSTNNDTGEDFPGLRDLDHNSANVQRNVKAYLKMLLNDFGYTGFRYDVAKGFSASFFGMYNTDARPQFSVGEYWDRSPTNVKTWINGTAGGGSVQSAAFDFPFRYTVRDAANGSDWSELGVSSLISDDGYRRYAVTFVENHDTERRSNAEQDPLKADTLAANAYMLAMPGTPCVFMKHWMDCKDQLRPMIDARRAAGIHNQSNYLAFASNKDYYAVRTVGSKGNLVCVVGTKAGSYKPGGDWICILSGHHYAYYLEPTMEIPFVDKGSGLYDEPFDVTLTAVSADANARLVYTTDGSEPTASSQQAVSGTRLHVDATTTLKVGLLVGGVVKNVLTRTYTMNAFEKKTITVYVNVDQVGWPTVYFWTWGGDDSHGAKNGWPGDGPEGTTTIDGKQWYYRSYTLNSEDDCVNFVFSYGTSSTASQNQTVDVNNVMGNAFFEVTANKDGGKYLVNNVSDQHTGIDDAPLADNGEWATAHTVVYDLQGRKLSTISPCSGKRAELEFPLSTSEVLKRLPKGVYIVGGRKVVVR